MMDHPEENREDVTYTSDTENEESHTDWENPPSIKKLQQDYQDAQSSHGTHTANVERWLDNLNIEGKAKPTKKTGRSEVQPKLIRKQAEWRYASLSEPFLSTDDLYNVNPVTFEDKEPAEQNELVLNHQFNNKINKVKFIDEYVRSAVDEGTVVVRVGWDFEEKIIEVEQPVIEEQVQVDPQTGQQFLAQVQVDTEIVEQTVTVKNVPTVEVCNYENVLIDPTCQGDLDKANFIIFSFETSLAELEKDKKYFNLDKINIENSNILGEPDYANPDESSFNFSDKPRKKFVAQEYWGFWDIHNEGTVEPIIATWVGNTMIRLEENPFPDQKLPFVSAQYLPVRKSIYGEPDGELLEDNQRIVGAVTRGMIDIMARAANGQVGSRADALDVSNKRKFDRGDDYEFNPGIDPNQAFHMHTYPEIPRSAQEMVLLQNAEAEALTGVKAFHQGISGEALGSTATGIRSAMDATAKRELGILRRLADGITKIGDKIVSMNSEFLSDEEIVRITNEDFVAVNREALAGEFDLSLSISTAEADNDKAKELAFMLQTMGPNSDPGEARIIQSEIARLRKMPALAKKIEEYQPPPPDPLQVALAQLEVKKLEVEIAKIESETAENYANAALDNAKARTEGSTADKTDLDFIEQESGVTQERELQKGQAQAIGNIALEREKQKAPKTSTST